MRCRFFFSFSQTFYFGICIYKFDEVSFFYGLIKFLNNHLCNYLKFSISQPIKYLYARIRNYIWGIRDEITSVSDRYLVFGVFFFYKNNYFEN